MADYKPLVLAGGQPEQLQDADGLDVSIGRLSDVTITTPADGQVLTYDGTNAVWVNADAAGGGGSVGGLYGVNVEALAADKTLTPGTDPIYQLLDSNGADRSITLDDTSASAGDRFIIVHQTSYLTTYVLNIYQGTVLKEVIPAQSTKMFIFDGTYWRSASNGTGTLNLAVGWKSSGVNYGTAFGSLANGGTSGTAIGYSANGASSGVSVGYSSNGATGGVAVGYYANGSSYGTTIGYYAAGYSYGVAIGQYANAYVYGVGVGYRSSASYSGTVVGAYAHGGQGGVSVGYQAGYSLTLYLSANKNILIGKNAGYNLTQPSKWVASTAYSVGDYVRPATTNGYNYECITAGTSGTTEPVWPTTLGDTVTDGTATWKCVSERGNNNIYIGYDIEGSAYDVNKLQIGNAIFGSLDIGSMGCGSVASLPTASEQYRGQFIRVEGGAGVKDVLYICEKDASDNYVWTAIT